MKNKRMILPYLKLHMIILFYSLGGIFSKKAALNSFFSFNFIFYYSITLLIMVIYAFLWQQIIKGIPLTSAYSAKAMTILWGILWGRIFFAENFTIYKLIGGLLVFLGVIVYSLDSGLKND